MNFNIRSGAGSTTDRGGDGISGDTNGTSEDNGVTLGSGATTIAFVSGARSIDCSGKTMMTVTDRNTSSELATVSVDPGTDMGFTDIQRLPIYKRTPEPNSNIFPYKFDNAEYSE